MKQGTFWRPYHLAPFRSDRAPWIDAGPGGGNPYRIGHACFPIPKDVTIEHDRSLASKYRDKFWQTATYQPFGVDGNEGIVCQFATFTNGQEPERSILVTTPMDSFKWTTEDADVRINRFCGLGERVLSSIEVASKERLRLRSRADSPFAGAFVTFGQGGSIGVARLNFPPLIQKFERPMTASAMTVYAFHVFIANGERTHIEQDGIRAEFIVDGDGELHVFSEGFAKRWLR